MLFTAHEVSLKKLRINGNDFSGYNVGTSKFGYILAPSNKNTSCIFQVLCSFDMDCENGNSIEFEAHVYNVFDNNNQRPLLMQLITLAENSEKYINDIFFENVPSIFKISKDVIKPNDHSKMLDLITAQLDEVYPLR